MENLIGMTDYVLYQAKRTNMPFIERFAKCDEYAKFFKKSLEPWMFAPCDENGNVLEQPGLMPSYERLQYLGAKERVLFEGIEYVKAEKEGHNSYFRISQLSPINYPMFWKDYTVEDLVKYNVKLTVNAQKQFL